MLYHQAKPKPVILCHIENVCAVVRNIHNCRRVVACGGFAVERDNRVAKSNHVHER